MTALSVGGHGPSDQRVSLAVLSSSSGEDANRAASQRQPPGQALGDAVGSCPGPDGGSLISVSCQDAPGVASGDTHQGGRLVQCHVLIEQTVQDLKSCLFFWIQSHILHTVNMTFLLAS